MDDLDRERAQLQSERRWLDSMRDALSRLGIFMKDLENGHDRPNTYWRDWGYTENEMRFDGWIEKLHPDDRSRVRAEVAALTRGGDKVYTIEYRVLTSTGAQRDILTKGIVASRDENGEPRSVVALDIDVTDLRNAERSVTEASREAQQRAEEAETLRTIGAVIASALDLEHATELVLEQIRHVVPYESASVQLRGSGPSIEVVGLQYPSPESLDRSHIHEHIPAAPSSPQGQVIRDGKPLRIQDMALEFPGYFTSQKRMNHSWLGVPLSVRGEVIGLLVLEAQAPQFFAMKHLRLAMNLVDYIAVAIQNAKAYSEVQEQAATDPLTGLRTRRWFFEHGDKLMSQARRYETPLAVLISDLDHFKRINDQYGHPTGDRVLRSLALIFLEEMRKADAICRYGGEEFAVLLPHTDLASAMAIAERLRKRAAEVTVEGTDQTLSVSIGVATLRETNSHSLTDLIAAADEALYRAKHEGRNRVHAASSRSIIQGRDEFS